MPPLWRDRDFCAVRVISDLNKLVVFCLSDLQSIFGRLGYLSDSEGVEWTCWNSRRSASGGRGLSSLLPMTMALMTFDWRASASSAETDPEKSAEKSDANLGQEELPHLTREEQEEEEELRRESLMSSSTEEDERRLPPISQQKTKSSMRSHKSKEPSGYDNSPFDLDRINTRETFRNKSDAHASPRSGSVGSRASKK